MGGERERRPNRKPEIPAWAQRERQADMGWIGENFHIFWPAATAAFEEMGRGAIVVDTTTQPVEGAGNPFGYFPQEFMELYDDDTKRFVKEYDPRKEMVVMLLKSHDRTSTYRVRLASGIKGK